MNGIYLWVEDDGAGDVITNPYRTLEDLIREEVESSYKLEEYQENDPEFVFDKNSYTTMDDLQVFVDELYDGCYSGVPEIRWIDLDNMVVI